MYNYSKRANNTLLTAIRLFMKFQLVPPMEMEDPDILEALASEIYVSWTGGQERP